MRTAYICRLDKFLIYVFQSALWVVLTFRESSMEVINAGESRRGYDSRARQTMKFFAVRRAASTLNPRRRNDVGAFFFPITLEHREEIRFCSLRSPETVHQQECWWTGLRAEEQTESAYTRTTKKNFSPTLPTLSKLYIHRVYFISPAATRYVCLPHRPTQPAPVQFRPLQAWFRSDVTLMYKRRSTKPRTRGRSTARTRARRRDLRAADESAALVIPISTEHQKDRADENQRCEAN